MGINRRSFLKSIAAAFGGAGALVLTKGTTPVSAALDNLKDSGERGLAALESFGEEIEIDPDACSWGGSASCAYREISMSVKNRDSGRWNRLSTLISINGPVGRMELIDVTHMASPSRVWRLGSVIIEMYWTKKAINRLDPILMNGSREEFLIDMGDGSKLAFDALVSELSCSHQMDNASTIRVELSIPGNVIVI